MKWWFIQVCHRCCLEAMNTTGWVKTYGTIFFFWMDIHLFASYFDCHSVPWFWSIAISAVHGHFFRTRVDPDSDPDSYPKMLGHGSCESHWFGLLRFWTQFIPVLFYGNITDITYGLLSTKCDSHLGWGKMMLGKTIDDWWSAGRLVLVDGQIGALGGELSILIEIAIWDGHWSL